MIFKNKLVIPYANDNTALIPEMWSKFSLAVLKSKMVAGNLVHRDFEQEFREFGSVVHTRKPGAFAVYNKTDDDEVTNQDATSTRINVNLDQHLHVSFVIKDGEETQSMQRLVPYYLVPAMTAMAERIDSIILGQVSRFIKSAQGGTVQGMTSSNAKDYILETGQRMDENKAPLDRTLVVTPNMKTAILKNSVFSEADKRGDQGTALREASLGRILGFDAYMCQNAPTVLTADKDVTMLINNSAGYVAGDTVLTVDGISGICAVGTWVSIGGRTHQVTASSATLGNTTSITVSPALFEAVANNAVVTQWAPGAIDFGAGYAAGYSKMLTLDGFTIFPKKGQTVSFGTDVTNIYNIVATNGSTTIQLDRPLVAALADDAIVNIGPAGDFGFAFTKNAVALVVRPLRAPEAGAGAMAFTASDEGFSMRAVIQYDSKAQGHRVTLDCLLGVAQLDSLCGAVLQA